MSGTNDGQLATANTFNSAYIPRNGDGNTTGKLDLENIDPASGGAVFNIQKEINNLFSALGVLKDQAIGLLLTFTNSNGFTAIESMFDRVESLSGKFHETTGHKHTGAPGDAPQITIGEISGVGFGAQSLTEIVLTSGLTIMSEINQLYEYDYAGGGVADVSVIEEGTI